MTVSGASPYRLSPSEREGLIFGYSDLAPGAIRGGAALLGEAIP